MNTQPKPHLEARPDAPDVQYRHPLHLPRRPRLRPAPQGTRAIDTHIPNIALAGFQLLIGYEWLLAGGDKLLLGTFPAQLGGMLLALVRGGHLVGFFAAILQGLVVPHAVLFGSLIEWGETLAGLGLMAAPAWWRCFAHWQDAPSAARARGCSCSVTGSSRAWHLLLPLARDCSA